MKNSKTTFHATLDPATGKVTVERIPPIDGAEDSITFGSTEEMFAALNPDHSTMDIQLILQELESFGSADFKISS